MREIRKAVCAFSSPGTSRCISTGPWGCGEQYGFGHVQLKFILQWIAASLLGKEVIFSASGSKELLQDIASFISEAKMYDVSVLWRGLRSCEKEMSGWDDSEKGRARGLFAYLVKQMNSIPVHES